MSEAGPGGEPKQGHRPERERPRERWAPTVNRGQYEAADVTAYLLAGPLVMGGLGWLGDRWLGTAFLLPIGLIAGIALALYVVLIRYGRS